MLPHMSTKHSNMPDRDHNSGRAFLVAKCYTVIMNTKQTLLSVIALLILLGLCLAFAQAPVKTAMPEETNTTQNMPQGKINIDMVCQNALAYTTFPDAASAEAFVQECKEGKHPEVIERFKADMNLGDGAQI